MWPFLPKVPDKFSVRAAGVLLQGVGEDGEAGGVEVAFRGAAFVGRPRQGDDLGCPPGRIEGDLVGRIPEDVVENRRLFAVADTAGTKGFGGSEEEAQSGLVTRDGDRVRINVAAVFVDCD